MLLKDKIAVIHGAGGAIGSAVARTFAREGARLFLSGRNVARVEQVAEDIVANGDRAEASQVDALDVKRWKSTRPAPSIGRVASTWSSTPSDLSQSKVFP